MNIKNILLIALTGTMLIACKAEIVELDIKTKDVFAAVNGEDGLIDFEAKFSNFGELDEEARAQVEALENILTKFMIIDDFELETTDMGYEITLEGEMPITNKRLDAAYYIHVSSSDIFDGYTFLELKTGDNFNNLSNQMSAINFMLSPDKFHPTKIKLKGKDKIIDILDKINKNVNTLRFNFVSCASISLKKKIKLIDDKKNTIIKTLTSCEY